MAEASRVPSAPTDDERMRAAVELAQGRSSPAAESLVDDRHRASRRRMTIAFVAAMLIGGLIGWLIAANDDDLTRRVAVPVWRSAVGWMLWLVGLIWCTVLVVRMVRSGWYRRQREGLRPFAVLTSRQRKAIVHQLRGKLPVVTVQLPLVRIMAENVIGGTANLWLFGAITVFLGGSAIRSGTVFQWSVFVVLAAIVVVGSLSHRRLLRRARAILVTPPSPTPDGARR